MTGPKTTGEPPISIRLSDGEAVARRRAALELSLGATHNVPEAGDMTVRRAKVFLDFIEGKTP